MSEEMYRDKYENIVNMDYSSVIIDLMQQRYQASMPRMSWLVMDIHEMTFESNSFDCVLEKGTLDALLVDERDPWNLSEENAVKMDRILERVGYQFTIIL
jgi:endothelin-converting enzyme